MYAGVVGAEMGTPDVGKRLLVEDIEVRDGEGKGVTVFFGPRSPVQWIYHPNRVVNTCLY